MSPRKKRARSSKSQQYCSACAEPARTKQEFTRDLLQGTLALAVVAALYAVFKNVAGSAFAPQAGNAASLGAIVLVGITASFSSCLALVGGLLLSVSATRCEDRDVAPAQKFLPLGMFNLGRLLGYFLLGGIVGAIGQSLSLSIRSTGFVMVAMAVVMLILGLRILRVVPKNFCNLPLPKTVLKRIQTLSVSKHPLAPMVLGALTFFVPCGFTQSVQLLALGSGGFFAGGLMMFAFALGTLPALLGISLASAFAEGQWGRLFFKFSGAVVVVLAALNLSAGLTLTGADPWQWLPGAPPAYATNDPNVTIDPNGQQIISLSVSEYGYTPMSFTIAPNRPTWIHAVAPQSVGGCASQLTAPAFNMSIPIKQGENWLGPIDPKQDFVIACSMGMMKANIHVRPS